ncbi:MAG: N-acetylmuramoyl-L-alanine amidase [Planctomycetes bacterium]|nr:N-acetylmuramoyl-L-alanine amidase [Planctomycetota bacterium]
MYTQRMQRSFPRADRFAVLARRPCGLVHSLCAALALLPLCACPSVPRKPVEEPPPIAEPLTPSWVKEPMSWHKLELIEQWLEVDAGRHSRELVIEAKLQLNEGRLQFSRRDIDSSAAPRETLQMRVESARKGFEEILADSSVSAGARNRAQLGLKGAAGLAQAPTGTGLAILGRKQWNARAPRVSNLTPLKGGWSRITVHHSAESTSDPRGGSVEDSAATVRIIQKYHMDDPTHRWGDIGYHFLIDGAGRIFEGRELQWQGAHAGGSNNHQNIGICMLGDFERRGPTDAARKSLQVLLDDLRARYRIPAERVVPHNSFGSTRCPGPALTAWLKSYK